MNVIIDGEEYNRLKWGDDYHYITYREYIKQKQEKIINESQLTFDLVGEELENFVSNHEQEQFNNRDCPCCGSELGEYHEECELEECPKCGGEILSCEYNVEGFISDESTTGSRSIESIEPDEKYEFEDCRASLTTGFKYADVLEQEKRVVVIEYDDENVLSVELYVGESVESIVQEYREQSNWELRYGENL